jgi:hypothetical protein
MAVSFYTVEGFDCAQQCGNALLIGDRRDDHFPVGA